MKIPSFQFISSFPFLFGLRLWGNLKRRASQLHSTQISSKVRECCSPIPFFVSCLEGTCNLSPFLFHVSLESLLRFFSYLWLQWNFWSTHLCFFCGSRSTLKFGSLRAFWQGYILSGIHKVREASFFKNSMHIFAK